MIKLSSEIYREASRARCKTIEVAASRPQVKKIEVEASRATVLVDRIYERDYPISIIRSENRKKGNEFVTDLILYYHASYENLVEDLIDYINNL